MPENRVEAGAPRDASVGPHAIVADRLWVRMSGEVIILSASFTIDVGRITYVAGPSGIGKSTLINVASGLVRPWKGQMRVLGVDPFDCSRERLRSLRLRMGVMYQSGALFQSLTLLENVMFPLIARKECSREKARERAIEALQLVHLEAWKDHSPGQVSGGQRKRAGLARAMVSRPDLLLCDEPCSGLDPALAAEIDEMIASLNYDEQEKKYRTIVVVSHDRDSILNYAKNVVFLGKHPGPAPTFFVDYGTKKKIQDSRNPVIRSFFDREPLAAAPMVPVPPREMRP